MGRILSVTRQGKLLEYLLAALPEQKRTALKQSLKHKSISVNGRIRTQFDYRLAPGDEIRIESSHSKPVAATLQFNLKIIYEDDSLIVINKPEGLLSIATEKVQRETAIFAVNDYLNKKEQAKTHRQEYRKRVFIVHRLDRDVSGLLVLAKDEAAKFTLQKNWDQFKKEYLAVVEGCPEKRPGTLSSYLTENKFLRVFSSRRPVGAESKKAVTHYEVLKSGKDCALFQSLPLVSKGEGEEGERFCSTPPLASPLKRQGEGKIEYSLLKIRLETGRKHQIRVHLSELGHPVAGDKNYNARTNPIGRIALHAWRLELKHPATGQNLVFTCPLPPPIARFIEEKVT